MGRRALGPRGRQRACRGPAKHYSPGPAHARPGTSSYLAFRQWAPGGGNPAQRARAAGLGGAIVPWTGALSADSDGADHGATTSAEIEATLHRQQVALMLADLPRSVYAAILGTTEAGLRGVSPSYVRDQVACHVARISRGRIANARGALSLLADYLPARHSARASRQSSRALMTCL